MSLRRPLLVLLAATTFCAVNVARAATAACVGDCSGDGKVTVNEVLSGVNAALDPSARQACIDIDANNDQRVTIDEILTAVNNALRGCTPVSTPALLSSAPSADGVDVPRSQWIRLVFAASVDPAALLSFALACDGLERDIAVYAVRPDMVLVNPVGELPSNAQCLLTWLAPNGTASSAFSTATAGRPLSVSYDRTDLSRTHPFPDDFWLVPDLTTPTGLRVAVPLPSAPGDVRTIFKVLLQETNKLDGFSPLAHFTIELSDAPDPASVPRTPAESLDPLATVGLFDLTPGAPAARVPFRLQIRDDTSVGGARSHSLLVFPSIPLTPGGRYGFVMTRRVLADPGRPLDPSAFFSAVVAGPVDGEPPAVTQARTLASDVLDAIATRATPPIPADDVALAVRVTVRTTDDIAHDLLAIKQQVLDGAPPAFEIDGVKPDADPNSAIAAIVSGTWQAPDWREGVFLARDAAGVPKQTKITPVPFILALPKAALNGPVPLTMYQHGNPGSAQAEVPSHARRSLASAGFAVIGFTDNLNREVSPPPVDDVTAITAQVTAVFFALLQKRKVPDYWVETNAEQIAFLQMIQGLGTLDVLPIGAPDGVPDLDLGAPLTYVGISEGANHAPGFLPYAPEIRAAALVAGGARLAEVLIHQQAEAFLTQLGPVYPNLTPTDIWVLLSLFQTIYDIQDPHNHARFIYRDPLLVSGTLQKPSILLIEGLNDTLVPNNATDSLAWAMGPIPHLKPVQRSVPFLEAVDGPLMANVDADTTAGFFQYVPVGLPDIAASPGCTVLSPGSATEGHYCAQSAAESLHQRVVFFQSAVHDPIPKIINPYSE